MTAPRASRPRRIGLLQRPVISTHVPAHGEWPDHPDSTLLHPCEVPLRLLFALSVLSSNALAQTPGQVRAATEVLELTRVRETVHALDSTYVQQTLKSDPQWQPYADILAEWSHSIYNWEAWRPQIIKRLATSFSEAELDSVATFYRGRIGRKWAAMRAPLQAYLGELFVKTEVEVRPLMMEKLRQRAAQLHKPLPQMRS